MTRILLLPSLILATVLQAQVEQNYIEYVNPMIGTGGHGHTYPGPVAPFGMVQLSPDTRIDGSWDGCSGYHYSDEHIYGFSHTHLSGTGCSDYGDVMLMPTAENSMNKEEYSSKFSHADEKAKAAYYAVRLKDDDIDVELTASTRVGFHRYQFHGSERHVVLDLTHRDKLLEGRIVQANENTIQGYRKSEAWASAQEVYYYITFSEPIQKITYDEQNKALLTFNKASNQPLLVKVAISSVDCEGAKLNLNTEVPHWDFEQVRRETEELWNRELSKIEIEENDKDKKTIFYTALYHTMTQPNIYNDVDQRYRGRDGEVHVAEGFNYYSVFSLWDTFRAAHPLYTLIDRQRTLDFIKTFLAQYQQGGRLPVWELACNETDCMIGYHSVSVIADAVDKGITDFDMELAFEAMKKSANWKHLGLPEYIEQGYIAVDDEHESVSKTLEYAYDDWCIARMANHLGKEEDYQNYMKRSQAWKNLYDPQTGFMRPRKNGGWLEPFDPREVNNNFTEGNSWQYSFFVPQDISGLIQKHGGSAAFEKKLDDLFAASTNTTGRHQVDITGLIGQYAHGNEPSHHMAYLYNYVYKPEKTKYYVHKILKEFYLNAPDGLIGNEDCGQMSAWYVLSALGLYQVTPGDTYFDLVEPYFVKASIHFENGEVLQIRNDLNKGDRVEIADFVLDNQPLDWRKVKYDKLRGAKALVYTTEKYHYQTAGLENNTPQYQMIVEAPIIRAGSKVFKDAVQIDIIDLSSTGNVYYSIDQAPTIHNTKRYERPFTITKSSVVYAYAAGSNEKSSTSKAHYYKLPHPEWKLDLNCKYNPQYTAGGDEGLIDGVRGEVNWRKGEWQGYQDQDFIVTIDLGKKTRIREVGAGYLQDTRAWILMPTQMEVELSTDGKHFEKVLLLDNKVDSKDYSVQIQNLSGKLKGKARYVRITAKNFGVLPEWHQGKGDQAFIFVDEVWVK